jgi:peptidoglycan L-alanyl-D-glutamate endopeptidase CwlK
MPLANFARINLDQLYLPFLMKLLDVIAACNVRGAHYTATCGYRSFGEQLALWAQGRTRAGRRVTNAGPGESAHNFGLAVDLVRMQPANTPDWQPTDYAVLGEEAERAGLVWGGGFKGLKDCPHVQWPGYVTAAELAPLKSIYLAHQEAPLSAVFEFLDRETPHA